MRRPRQNMSQGLRRLGSWVLEYHTVILFLVLGSYYSYLYLKSIFFSGFTPKLRFSAGSGSSSCRGFRGFGFGG